MTKKVLPKTVPASKEPKVSEKGIKLEYITDSELKRIDTVRMYSRSPQIPTPTRNTASNTPPPDKNDSDK